MAEQDWPSPVPDALPIFVSRSRSELPTNRQWSGEQVSNENGCVRGGEGRYAVCGKEGNLCAVGRVTKTDGKRNRIGEHEQPPTAQVQHPVIGNSRCRVQL